MTTKVTIRNSLHQGEHWITQDGRELRLDDMSMGHRRNLLAFIRRRADRYKFHALWSLAAGQLDVGDAASDLLDAMITQIERTPANEWIEEQRLVIRLRQLVEGDAPTRRRRALAMPMPAGLIPGGVR